MSIEPSARKQVYDLTIPGTHNFVANDVCVHNTAFALNLVRHVVVEEGQPVFFVSLEQSRIELAERLLCCQARVDSHKLRKGHLSSDDMQKLIEAGGVLRQAQAVHRRHARPGHAAHRRQRPAAEAARTASGWSSSTTCS